MWFGACAEDLLEEAGEQTPGIRSRTHGGLELFKLIIVGHVLPKRRESLHQLIRQKLRMELRSVHGVALEAECLVAAVGGKRELTAAFRQDGNPVMVTHQHRIAFGHRLEKSVVGGVRSRFDIDQPHFRVGKIGHDLPPQGTSDELMSPAGSEERLPTVDDGVDGGDQRFGERVVIHHRMGCGTTDEDHTGGATLLGRTAGINRQIHEIKLGGGDPGGLQDALALVLSGDVVGSHLEEKDIEGTLFGHGPHILPARERGKGCRRSRKGIEWRTNLLPSGPDIRCDTTTEKTMTTMQQTAQTPTDENTPPVHSDALVIFGVSGDLAKKMTFVSLYKLAERGLLKVPFIGVAFTDWSDDDFKAHALQSIKDCGQEVDSAVWDVMSAKMTYVQGDYTKDETYQAVKAKLGDARNPLFYLEIPPSLFLTAVQGLHAAGLTENARVVIEKPFGHDYDSAVKLYGELSQMLNENQIYRIDHYLGKNAIQDIMVWRFSNRMFEPIWNSAHIESVQITMAESFDVADRGSFYDRVGALKDVVQNHIMQIIGLLSMDPPSTATPAAIHAQQLHAFESMRPIEPADYVRGQYTGYHDVEGVAEGSTTETFVAIKLYIDSWRWAGVPFFIRTGKNLGCTATEAVVVYKRPPLQLFKETGCPHPERNRLRFRFGHGDDGVQMQVQALDPSSQMASKPVVLNVDFSEALGEEKLPYEQLLGDALQGIATRFATQKIIEGTWIALSKILANPGPAHEYAPGTMGPSESNALIEHYGGWIAPVGSKSDHPA